VVVRRRVVVVAAPPPPLSGTSRMSAVRARPSRDTVPADVMRAYARHSELVRAETREGAPPWRDFRKL
jgi:hypothetical protein